jgi:DNA modification methylase
MNPIVTHQYRVAFEQYRTHDQRYPLLLLGDASQVLQEIPDSSIDCVMTSPPYWRKREYEHGGIGGEKDFRAYLRHLVQIVCEVKRVLKPTGSFWLNIGDSYHRKTLLGIPWRIALELIDHHGWILRNAVVWHKVKSGMDSTTDRLANRYEMVFHFVKQSKGYYYHTDAIRSHPRAAKVVHGAVVSATGVSGIRYRRQIERSTALSEEEKRAAREALDKVLAEVAAGQISDFRMILRGQQRTTHSDSIHVSGRAKELHEKGFYILRYHPNGCKPTDVWDILPEDTQRRDSHGAPYPVDLCRIPIVATCPPEGIVLDPFCGTGTTLYAAYILDRRSVGIDMSPKYLEMAMERCLSLRDPSH